MTIGQALQLHEGAQAVFMGFGMQCFGCPMAITETIEEACASHDVELDDMLDKLNALA